MLDVLFVALFQAVSGDPAAAPAADPAQATAPAPAVDPAAPERGDRRRCRSVRVTGSLRSQRVCTTQQQDEAKADAHREEFERALDRPNQRTVGGISPGTN